MRRVATVVVALILGGSFAACGNGDGGVLPTTSPETAPPTVPPPPEIHFPTPQESLGHLFLQWEVGDREAATQAAAPDVVDALFQREYRTMQARGCDATGTCAYRYGDELITFEVRRTGPDEGWRVEQLR